LYSRRPIPVASYQCNSAETISPLGAQLGSRTAPREAGVGRHERRARSRLRGAAHPRPTASQRRGPRLSRRVLQRCRLTYELRGRPMIQAALTSNEAHQSVSLRPGGAAGAQSLPRPRAKQTTPPRTPPTIVRRPYHRILHTIWHGASGADSHSGNTVHQTRLYDDARSRWGPIHSIR
jgi:hypothetical protein